MASAKQIAANQLNAQKCTGPRSIQGKKISSQNALKTGLDAKAEIIRGENQADYETLIAEYYARFHPGVPEERCLVDALIKAEWFGRRYMAVETAVWERDFSNSSSVSPGLTYMRQSDVLARVDRRINSAQRNFSSMLKQLLALQAQHAAECPSGVDTETSPDQPAQPDPPQTDVATEPLTNELVSFRTSADPGPSTLPGVDENDPGKPEKEDWQPPIAA